MPDNLRKCVLPDKGILDNEVYYLAYYGYVYRSLIHRLRSCDLIVWLRSCDLIVWPCDKRQTLFQKKKLNMFPIPRVYNFIGFPEVLPTLFLSSNLCLLHHALGKTASDCLYTKNSRVFFSGKTKIWWSDHTEAEMYNKKAGDISCQEIKKGEAPRNHGETRGESCFFFFIFLFFFCKCENNCYSW